jgi:hypothetical protein
MTLTTAARLLFAAAKIDSAALAGVGSAPFNYLPRQPLDLISGEAFDNARAQLAAERLAPSDVAARIVAELQDLVGS